MFVLTTKPGAVKSLAFLIIVTVVTFAACKKMGPQEPTPQPPSADTLKATGNKEPSLIDTTGLLFAEDLDTAAIPSLRVLSTDYTVPYLPGIGDQGLYQSCTAWAVGYGMLSAMYKSTEPGFEASPAYIYNQMVTDPSDGTSIADALKLLKEQGCCDASHMPKGSLYTIQPSPPARANAALHKISEYHLVSRSGINIELIKTLLRKNYTLPVSIAVDAAFILSGRNPDADKLFRKEQDGRYTWEKYNSGSDRWHHAMLIIGYDNSIKAFKIQNSWDKKWGHNGGYAWIDYDHFKKVVTTDILNRPRIFWATRIGLQTKPATTVNATSVIGNGEVQTLNGSMIIAKGFCWSETDKPDMSIANLRDYVYASTSALGVFQEEIKSLKPNTKYYYRAFKEVSTGKYVYGNTESFTTLNLKVAENGQGVNGTVNFFSNLPKLFTLVNLDATPTSGLNYNLVSVANNSNNAITITRSNTNSNFSLTLSSTQSTTQNTSFDVLYNGTLLQTVNAQLSNTDSTDYYKSIVPGAWTMQSYTCQYSVACDVLSETHNYQFNPGGTGVYVSSTENLPPYRHTVRNQNITWNVTKQGNQYILSFSGGATGPISVNKMNYSVNNAYKWVVFKN